MNTQELRIGNLVHVDNLISHPQLEGEELVVIGINYDSIRLNWHDYTSPFDYNYNQFIEFIKPIPITEDWLLEFGFEKINHINGYSFFSIIRKRRGDIPSITIYPKHTTIGNNSRVNHCIYIHQIQNLYFALTGEEFKF